jgi:uncharacterized membrane protein
MKANGSASMWSLATSAGLKRLFMLAIVGCWLYFLNNSSIKTIKIIGHLHIPAISDTQS